MKYEDTTGNLRQLADQLFNFVAEAVGAPPALQGWKHCYKAQCEGHRALYLEIVGPQGRLRQNAIKLNTAWTEALGALSGVEGGNDLHGSNAAELWIHVKNPDIQTAEAFILLAVNG